MKGIYFEIEGNVVIRHTPMPEIGKDIYKSEVVMNKEIFQECYKKWVKPQESEKINCKATKCENCKNHNYCDYEPQERSE